MALRAVRLYGSTPTAASIPQRNSPSTERRSPNRVVRANEGYELRQYDRVQDNTQMQRPSGAKRSLSASCFYIVGFAMTIVQTAESGCSDVGQSLGRRRAVGCLDILVLHLAMHHKVARAST